MKNTVSNINIITNIIEALHSSQEDIRRRAADAAANEVGYAYGGAVSVKLFSDCTGNYAEVTLPGEYDCVCGMKLCCIVDTDTMQVRGVCPVE